MDTMLSPDEEYPFDKIKIKTPKALQGGTYCANLEIDNNPVIIQTPKCKTKNGIHKTAKQIYCDLVMNRDHQTFLDWIEKFQERVRYLILENSSKWFHESPSLDEIEYNWTDSIRTRKDYCLLRTFVHKPKGISKISLQIFDSDENQLNIDQVESNKNVICILEIIGLKFSSNSFHLEICLRQMMVINEKPLFNKCLIKLNSKKENGENLNENKSLVIQNLVDNDDITNKEENQKKEPLTNNLVDNDDITNKEDKKEEEPEGVNEAEDNIEEVEKTDKKEENLEELPEEENMGQVEENKKDEENNKIKEEEELPEEKPLEKNNDLEEIELIVPEEEPMKLKDPNEVYLDIYKAAREKARKAKNEAIKAYLEAKRIKELYMLDVVDSSSDEEEEEEEEELFSEN
jgi:hypothetical protein